MTAHSWPKRIKYFHKAESADRVTSELGLNEASLRAFLSTMDDGFFDLDLHQTGEVTIYSYCIHTFKDSPEVVLKPVSTSTPTFG